MDDFWYNSLRNEIIIKGEKERIFLINLLYDRECIANDSLLRHSNDRPATFSLHMKENTVAPEWLEFWDFGMT